MGSVALLGGVWDGAAQVPIGPEFQINMVTSETQRDPYVAADGAGGFVVVWNGPWPTGLGRRYDASARPLGGEFDLTAPGSFVTEPGAAFDASGAFVVAWSGEPIEVYARLFDPDGLPRGSAFQVNVYTTSTQRDAVVSSDAGGNFVVLWADDALDGHGGVFGRLFDPAGAPRGPEFQVTDVDSGGLSVAHLDGGRFVVVWSSVGDGSLTGVFAQRYDASGLPLGPRFQVNTYTTDNQASGSVAADASGRFVIVWTGFGPGGISDSAIFGQRYDNGGAPIGGEFRVNSYTDSGQFQPAVAAAATGEFMVTWSNFLQDGYSHGVFGRLYDKDATALGPEFPVNAHTTRSQFFPHIAAGAAGTFVVVWENDQAVYWSVEGRRFGPDLIFEDDFETGSFSAWSAAATDGGDLHVSAAAALGTPGWGLEAVIDDTAGLYVQDDRPQGEHRYRARFYFDPATFDPGEAQGRHRMRLFLAFSSGNAQRRVAAVVLRRLAGVYAVMARARLDDDSQADTGFVTVDGQPHAIELDLVRATSADAQDGSLQLWVDGVLEAQLSGLDNNAAGVDFVRLGALSLKAGSSGTLYLDDFASRRQGDIGLID